MKNFVFTMFLLGFYVSSFSQITLIPDPNFEQQLVSLGIDSDQTINGQVATADVVNVTELFIGGSEINDLTGIEDFESLEVLFVENNFLTSIDVSDLQNLTNLDIPFNQISELDVSNNSMLQVLGATGNFLTSLNLENNVNLEALFIGVSDGITVNNTIPFLDLSNNVNLNWFQAEAVSLETLNLKNGNNTVLTSVSITDNPNLSCLQVDDAIAANNGSGPYENWEVDPQVVFSENCILGVAETSIPKIVLFPNPITDNLYINYEGSITQIQISDILGSIVLSQNFFNEKLDLSFLSAGSYFVKITSQEGKGVFIKKIIKL